MAITIKTVTKTNLGSIAGNTGMYNGANLDEIFTDLVSQINAKLTSAMHYKGTVANYDALPTANVEIGDVYNVTDTGKNYACSANDPAVVWDELTGIVDLSAYLTDEENEAKYLQIVNFASVAETNGYATKTYAEGKIADAIAALGALASKDKVAKSDLADALSAELDAKATQTALEAVDAKFADYTKTELLKALAFKDKVAYADLDATLAGKLDAKAENADLTALAARVTQNETDISTNAAGIAANLAKFGDYTPTANLGVLALLTEAQAKAKLDSWGYGKADDVTDLQTKMAAIAAVSLGDKTTTTLYNVWDICKAIVDAAGASA